MKNKEQKTKRFFCRADFDRVSDKFMQQNVTSGGGNSFNCSSKSIIRKHVLSGVLAFLICFAIFAAVVFPLQQTSQISSPLSTIAATGPNNTDGWWIDDGRRGDSFAGGTGTQDDPYLIETAEQLAYLSYLVYSGTTDPQYSQYISGNYYFTGAYFKQTANIDLSDYYWQPIGISYNRNGTSTAHYFSGYYDGGGHTVSGVFTPAGSTNAYSNQGLFGCVYGISTSVMAQITNLGVVDSFIQGYQNVAGIAGYIGNSLEYGQYESITNCYNSAAVIASDSFAGGIVGDAGGVGILMLNTCFNRGTISANSWVGGIIGRGRAENCYNTGTITSTSTSRACVGGISGYGSSITNSFNIGEVVASASTEVGGISGGGNTSTNCYYGGNCGNIGAVNGSDRGTSTYVENLDLLAKDYNWLTSTMGFDMYFVWKLDPEQNDGYPVFITDPAEANWWLASEENYDLEWEGDGSRTNPYQISSAEELAGLSYRLYSGTGEHTGNYYYPNRYFVLTTNIDLSAHAWEPIGSSTAYFSGIFDGAGYEISGVMGSSSYTYFALFSHVVGYGNRAEIKNLTVTDSVINAGTGAAGILVLGENISISNCTSDVTSLTAIGGSNFINVSIASGIALSVYNGVIENCENRTSEMNSSLITGIVTFVSNSQITSCINYGDLNIGVFFSAGIAGAPMSLLSGLGITDLMTNPSNSDYSTPATITDCANYGNLNGDGNLMGTAGIVISGAEVVRCVNYGNLYGSRIAAIIYINADLISGTAYSNTRIEYCVNYGTITGYSGGTAGSVGGIIYELSIPNSNIIFANCTNYGEINGDNFYGSSMAYQVTATVDFTFSNLTNYAQISAVEAAGLFYEIQGQNGISIILENCVNAGNISGNYRASGLVVNTSNSGWTIGFENCVNTGNVSGNETSSSIIIGGIIASVTVPVTMTSVFSLGDLTRTAAGGTVGGLIGKSTASEITIENCVFEGNITLTDSATDTYAGGFIGIATGCSSLSITGSYVNANITVESTSSSASGMIGSITMSDTSSPAAIDKCAVVANISTLAEGEMTNSREFYFSPNLVDSATILNSYALFNNALTISDTTTGMDGYFAYLDNFQNGLPIPIGLYYITSYGTTTGIVDQLQKFVG